MISKIGIDNCLNDFVQSVEYFDKDKLYYILSHKDKYQKILCKQEEIDIDNKVDMLEIVRRYFMLSLNQGKNGYITKTGHINVNYRNRNNVGRLFADNCLSLQNINRKIKHVIAGEYYVDIDMVNAHPVILEYICKKINITCSYLSYYNKNRNKIINKYVEEGFKYDTIKELILTIINGGCRSRYFTTIVYRKIKKEKININNKNWIVKFNAELIKIRESLKKRYIDRYNSIIQFSCNHDSNDSDNDIDSYNYQGKLISSLMCDGENIILGIMIDFFKEKGIINKLGRMDAVLCFDGIMVNRRNWRDSDSKQLLDECEKSIAKTFAIEIKLKIKPMNTTWLKLPTYLPHRPNPNNDIFMYQDYIDECSTWLNVCKLKNELVHFINKNTCAIKGSMPMIIKENIKYDDVNVIDRVFKLDVGFKFEMANVKFKVSLSQDEIKKNSLSSSDLTINGYQNWLTSRYRNDKENIIFDPKYFYDNKPLDNIYNLFNGLSIERDTLLYTKPLEETEPFFQHILNIWCKGNKESYEYVLNWFSSIIQFPWKKLRSCIVLKSTERAGKGIIIDKIREILGEIYVFHPTSVDDILGNFNVGCRNKLLIFMDELVWGGDKQRAGIFKKLITEKTISVNEKFKSIYTIKNLVNIIIASNESWVVPAGTTDTRWFCLGLDSKMATCSNKEKKFMIDNILDTDIKRLSKFFYQRDIKDWNSDEIIITDELREQRIQSMSPLNKWWFDCLNNGFIECNSNKYYFGSEFKIPRINLYGSYIEYSLDKHMVKRLFNKNIAKIWGTIYISQPRINGKQIRCFNMPELDDMKNIWRNKYADNDWTFDDPEEPSESDSENYDNE